MVKRLTPIVAIVLVGLIVAACGTPPAQQTGQVAPGVATPTFIPTLGVDAYNAQIATANALSIRAQETRDGLIAEETRVAGAATATAAAIATATQSVINTSVAATASAATTSAQALSIRQTDTALDMSIADATRGASMTSTWTAYEVDVQTTTQAQLAQQNQNAIDAAAEQQRIDNQIRQAEAERQANWSNFTRVAPYLITLIIVVVGVVAVAFFFYKEQSKAPQVFNGNVLMIKDGNGGQPMIYDIGPPRIESPHQPLLPSNVIEPVVSSTDSGAKNIPPASWDAFSRWNDPRLIPIGCHAVSRKPILVNRERKPHLMIAGDTGSGKTTLAESYVAGSLSAGLHVLIINNRGDDFSVFNGYPNVTFMPRVKREDRTALLGMVLDGLVSEMDRRDGVLSRYSARNWHELPAHAGQPGEFMVVVDEFLALVLDAQLRDKLAGEQMWLSLLNLTQEARKFGIYVTVTVTDPTTDALGKYGMVVRRQMGRIALAMGNAGASRQFIEVGKDEGWPRGSVGLPMGQFLGRVRGPLEHGVGFRPSPEQMRQYLGQHNPAPNDLPDNILQLTSGRAPLVAEAWSDEADEIGQLFMHDAQPRGGTDWLTHEKAPEILHYAPQATSLRRIEARVFEYTGGQATLTVKGVLIARAVQLYANGTSPYEIERTLFGGPKPFSPDIIQEAITQYQQLPLAR